MKLSNGDVLTMVGLNPTIYMKVKNDFFENSEIMGGIKVKKTPKTLSDVRELFTDVCESIKSKEGKDIEVTNEYVMSLGMDDFKKVESSVLDVALEAVKKMKG